MKRALKQIYQLIPFKKDIFSTLKKFWSPKESVYKHLHFKGVITVPIDKSKSFKMNHYGFKLENDIFWGGLTRGWEKESLRVWLKLCETSDIILDIGANTGVYSLLAKATNPQARVYAFEPVARVFNKLQENIKLNNFDITTMEKAVSNADGTAIIYDTAGDHTYSVTVNKNLNASKTQVVETKIVTITLNSFIKQNNITKIDLIKIDVESHEPEVIEGFSEYIAQFKPSILIEVWNDEIGGKINNLLRGLDYLYFEIDETTGLRQINKIVKGNTDNFLICRREIALRNSFLNKLF